MEIVVTNDDGIDEPGIAALETLARELGDVVTVAPRDVQSGVGHQLTENDPLPLEERGEGRFAVAGTPADCTRVALGHCAPAARWVLSGINEGANLGLDAYVSGTVAAAREAAAHGLPAIALSQYVARFRKIDWSVTVARARPVLAMLFERGCEPGEFWSVNLPHPADDTAACEWVECPPDTTPQPPRFALERGHLRWLPDYHERPRRSGHDVAVCFGGKIAITRHRL